MCGIFVKQNLRRNINENNIQNQQYHYVFVRTDSRAVPALAYQKALERYPGMCLRCLLSLLAAERLQCLQIFRRRDRHQCLRFKKTTMDVLVDKLMKGPSSFKGKDPIDSFCGLFDKRKGKYKWMK